MKVWYKEEWFEGKSGSDRMTVDCTSIQTEVVKQVSVSDNEERDTHTHSEHNVGYNG
jgi:hypothetical protein